MESLTKDILSVLQYLLPGFISAWIFYAFTSYEKPTQFERVVEALIYTIFIQFIVSVTEKIALKIGNNFSIFVWDNYANLGFSIFYAVIIGFMIATLANNDKFHRVIRKMKISKESSYPSEWFSAFHNNITYVVLHLKDERRLYGWPSEWPSSPTAGHFMLTQASWLTKKGKEIKIDSVEYILVNVEDVQWVEFLEKTWEENDGKKSPKSTTTVT